MQSRMHDGEWDRAWSQYSGVSVVMLFLEYGSNQASTMIKSDLKERRERKRATGSNSDERMNSWLRQQIAIEEEQEQMGLSVLLCRRHVGSEQGSLRTKA